MKILLGPQVVFSDKKIFYEIDNEIITVEYKGQSEVFDFTDLPDGRMEEIESKLDVMPITSAKKLDGILYVELLNFIDSDASEAEKFPEWMDAKDYVSPEEEVEVDEDKVEE